MRGHLVKRYENSWTVVIDLGRDPTTGKRKQQWVSVKGTKKDAEKRLSELLHQVDTGNYVQPTKATVAHFLTSWLEDYAKVNLSPRGYERYRDIVRQHLIPTLGHVALTQLRPEHLQHMYTAALNAGLSPRTVRYHHAVLHVALKTAMKWGSVSRNVADSVEPPKVKRQEMQTWNETEVSRFLEAAKSSPYYPLFYLALYTGMRRSELLGLCWANVDFIFCQIQVTRGLHHLKSGEYVLTEPKSAKSRRTIALSPSAVLTLQHHHDQQAAIFGLAGMPLPDDTLVFHDADNKPLRPNTVTRAWTTLATRAGLKPIRLHDARHTHASLLLKQNVHPKIVQERLGHSSIEMTLDLYSHVAPGLQQAAAQKFDDLIPTAGAVTAHMRQ